MNNKKSAIIMGLVFIIVGLMYMFRDTFDIDISAVMTVAFGLGFLMLYKNKRMTWALVPSVYLIYWGVAKFICQGWDIYNFIICAMFFIAPAIIFGILYIRGKREYLLTFSCMLFFMGIAIIIYGMGGVPRINVFWLCIGLGLLINFILAQNYEKRAKLYLGVIISLLSLKGLIQFRDIVDAIMSVGLIVLGLVVIVKSLLPEKKEEQ